MNREEVVESLAGDLEYHPRRAGVYLLLGAASLSLWITSPHDLKITVTSLVFLLGSFTLLIKGIFLLRKSSEGFGLSEDDLAKLSDPAHRKPLPPIPNMVAQIVQDFGAGPFLLGPLLAFFRGADRLRGNPNPWIVFEIGALLFLAGWGVRRLTEQPKP